jgi:hypothetical protein
LHAATITKKALRPFSDYLTRRQCNTSNDNGSIADKQAFNSTGHHVFLSSFASGPLKPSVSVMISIFALSLVMLLKTYGHSLVHSNAQRSSFLPLGLSM